MSAQLDTLVAAVADLGTSVAALVAKPPVSVPEDLTAVTASVVALKATVDAAVSA